MIPSSTSKSCAMTTDQSKGRLNFRRTFVLNVHVPAEDPDCAEAMSASFSQKATSSGRKRGRVRARFLLLPNNMIKSSALVFIMVASLLAPAVFFVGGGFARTASPELEARQLSQNHPEKVGLPPPAVPADPEQTVELMGQKPRQLRLLTETPELTTKKVSSDAPLECTQSPLLEKKVDASKYQFGCEEIHVRAVQTRARYTWNL